MQKYTTNRKAHVYTETQTYRKETNVRAQGHRHLVNMNMHVYLHSHVNTYTHFCTQTYKNKYTSPHKQGTAEELHCAHKQGTWAFWCTERLGEGVIHLYDDRQKYINPGNFSWTNRLNCELQTKIERNGCARSKWNGQRQTYKWRCRMRHKSSNTILQIYAFACNPARSSKTQF